MGSRDLAPSSHLAGAKSLWGFGDTSCLTLHMANKKTCEHWLTLWHLEIKKTMHAALLCFFSCTVVWGNLCCLFISIKCELISWDVLYMLNIVVVSSDKNISLYGYFFFIIIDNKWVAPNPYWNHWGPRIIHRIKLKHLCIFWLKNGLGWTFVAFSSVGCQRKNIGKRSQIFNIFYPS